MFSRTEKSLTLSDEGVRPLFSERKARTADAEGA